jgi:hypothetical protein
MNSIRAIFFFMVIILGPTMQGQTIIPGGYVSGTWDLSGSPYFIEDDILIHPDSTLTIDAGTNVLFFSKKLLEIQGQLIVNGELGDFVYFTGDQDTTTWYGLFFNTTDTSITDSSILLNADIFHCEGHPCMTIDHSSRLRINGCTIRYGDSFRGGGISCISSNPYFEDMLVAHNYALDGAGISLDHSSPLMVNCSIYQNTAYGAGGGMAIFDYSNPLIIHCQMTGNQSTGSGGGVYINNASPVFRNTIIDWNEGAIGGSSLYSGGGVSVKLACHPLFENCNFRGNQSHREGGGIASFSENEIINCFFRENSALVKGGAVYLSSGNLIVSHLTNCTFSSNESPQGNALAVLNHTGVLRNCILWHSNPSNPGSLIHLDATYVWNVMDAGYSDIQNGQAGIELAGAADYIWDLRNLELDPQFLPETCELSWNSPCIEAGTPDTSGLNLPEYDLNGNPRIANGLVDIGAYEYQLPLGIPSAGWRTKFQIQNEFRIFPNPARDWVAIDFEFRIQNALFQILSIDGKVLLEEEWPESNKSFRIDVKGFPPGLYSIIIRNDEYNYSEKLIINR